jgi:hypothetical protein
MNQSAHREPAPDALEVPEASEAAASTAHAQPLIRLAQDNDMPAIQAIYAWRNCWSGALRYCAAGCPIWSPKSPA